MVQGIQKTMCAYVWGAFQSRGLSPTLMTILFQQILMGATHVWSFSLDTHKTRNWEEVIKAFVTKYEYNEELDVTIKDL